jgi:hypothetical protein
MNCVCAVECRCSGPSCGRHQGTEPNSSASSERSSWKGQCGDALLSTSAHPLLSTTPSYSIPAWACGKLTDYYAKVGRGGDAACLGSCTPAAGRMRLQPHVCYLAAAVGWPRTCSFHRCSQPLGSPSGPLPGLCGRPKTPQVTIECPSADCNAAQRNLGGDLLVLDIKSYGNKQCQVGTT